MTRTIFKTFLRATRLLCYFGGILVIYGKDVWQSPLYNFEER